MTRLLVALLLLLPAVASAQSTTGFFDRPLCSTIPTPATNAVVCWERTTQVLFWWNGSAYVPLTGAGAVVLSIIGTAHQILASNPTGNVTLSLDNPVAELPALFYGAALQ